MQNLLDFLRRRKIREKNVQKQRNKKRKKAKNILFAQKKEEYLRKREEFYMLF